MYLYTTYYAWKTLYLAWFAAVNIWVCIFTLLVYDTYARASTCPYEYYSIGRRILCHRNKKTEKPILFFLDFLDFRIPVIHRKNDNSGIQKKSFNINNKNTFFSLPYRIIIPTIMWARDQLLTYFLLLLATYRYHK